MSLILFVSFVFLKITFYKTWGNNDHYFYHPKGYQVECEFKLFGYPDMCTAIDEYGHIRAISTGIGHWKSVWTGPTPFIKND